MEEFNPEGSGPHALTMHQPWASMLVHGIKRIEGRSWPTGFRGRLWIHAASKEPSAQTIQETEAMFASVWALEGVTPKFPKHYPCSALLGCVDVVDCLTVEQIEHWTDLPESVRAEVGSAHGFLCQKPQVLLIPQPMSGAQMIWSMPARIAKQFEPALKSAARVGPEPWSWSKYTLPENLRTARLRRSQNRRKWSSKYGVSCADERGLPETHMTESPIRARIDRSASWRASGAISSQASGLANAHWPTATELKGDTDKSTDTKAALPPPAPPPVVNVWAARLAAKESSAFGGVISRLTSDSPVATLDSLSSITTSPQPRALQNEEASEAVLSPMADALPLFLPTPPPLATRSVPRPSLGVGALLAARRDNFLPLLQPALVPAVPNSPVHRPPFGGSAASVQPEPVPPSVHLHPVPETTLQSQRISFPSVPPGWGAAQAIIPPSTAANILLPPQLNETGLAQPIPDLLINGMPRTHQQPNPSHQPFPEAPSSWLHFQTHHQSLPPALSPLLPRPPLQEANFEQHGPGNSFHVPGQEYQRLPPGQPLLDPRLLFPQAGAPSQTMPGQPLQPFSGLYGPATQGSQQRWNEFRPPPPRQQRWAEFQPHPGSWIQDKDAALPSIPRSSLPTHMGAGLFTALCDAPSPQDSASHTSGILP